MQSRETIVSRDHGRSRGYGERFPNNLIRRQRKAGNRHCARTHSMSDTGASVPPPIDSIPSPPTANDAAAAVTPEKEKPPRPAESRSIPFGKRAIAESEVDTAHSRARPARELRPTHVSGSGLCARSCRQLQCAPPSTRCRAFAARRASTGSTSRRCTLIEQVAEQRRRQKLHVQSSPRAAPSCAASSLLSLPPCREKTPPAPASREEAAPCGLPGEQQSRRSCCARTPRRRDTRCVYIDFGVVAGVGIN